MKIDLYVKVCLTVIAVSLGTIAFKDLIAPQANAADLNLIEDMLRYVVQELGFLKDQTFNLMDMCRKG